jgi:hypothetical protein
MEWNIKKLPWISKPVERWNAGLLRAGGNFRGALVTYSQLPKSPCYVRTGATRKKAGFKITKTGQEMEFGSTHYLKYPLFGTGLYGPARKMIVPINKKFLRWRCGRTGQWIYAKQSKGYIWTGMKEKIQNEMEAGFRKGIESYSH